jgi:hypothetical protein
MSSFTSLKYSLAVLIGVVTLTVICYSSTNLYFEKEHIEPTPEMAYRITVVGYSTCPYFRRAARLADGLSKELPKSFFANVKPVDPRAEYKSWLEINKKVSTKLN